jgi:ABC-2 type transport system ATP-binding protein
MIEMRGVTRRFGSVTALRDATFTVRPGEIVALLGPNGAGKTTASRIIGGILGPSDGEAIVDGVSVRDDPNAVRARCGLVTDQPSLYERMTLRAYLAFFARLFDVTGAKERIAALARLLLLEDVLDRKLGAFSRGMKQKAAIARALIHDPRVLLLDEPATALDPEMARTLRDLIVSLRADDRAILLCTHDLDEAQRIADRVVILQLGAIVRTGTPDELRNIGRPRLRLEAEGDLGRALAAFARAGIAPAHETAGGRLVFRFEADDPRSTTPTLLRALLDADVIVLALVPEQLSLEDAYVTIVREARV